MRFADPEGCPACRGRLDGSTRCPSCGIDLTSPRMTELWQTLLHADSLLAAALAERDTSGSMTAGIPTFPASGRPAKARPAAGPTAPPPAPPPPTAPPPPQPAAAPRAGSWSVGTVLLALGAFGLVVAALIFVSRSWDSIGLAGKAAIMLAATALVGAGAVWVTRRPLRASAEALWSVFLTVLVVDLAAARGEGLAGLDGVAWSWWWVVAGVALAAVSAGVLTWSRGPVGRELWAPALGAVAGVAIAAGGIVGVVDAEAFWRLFAGLVVAGVLGLALRVTGSRRIAIGVRTVLAVLFAGAVGAAFVELLAHPSWDEVSSDLHGLPLVLVALASVAIGLAIPSARILMGAVAFASLAALVVVPSTDAAAAEGLMLSLAGTAVLPAVAVLRGRTAWHQGVRIGIALPAAGMLLVAAWWLGGLMYQLGRLGEHAWERAASSRLVESDISDPAAWATVVLAVALVAVAVVLPRWPELARWRGLRSAAFGAACALGVIGVVLATRPAVGLAVAVCLVAATAAVGALSRVPTDWSWAASAAVGVAVGGSLAIANQGTSVVAWIAGGLLCGAVALLGRSGVAATVGLAAAPLLAGGAAAGGDLADLDRPICALLAVGAALLVMAGAALVGQARVLPTELAAGVTAVVTLVAVGDGWSGALGWTAAGVACCALAAVLERRRWYALAGVIALVIAYVLLVTASEFTFVEAYTLPLGVAATAAGLWWMRRRPQTGTWAALGAGVSIVLLPSVPQALAEPTGLRALLLGAAAVLVLAVGARLDWQAPFVLGTSVAALVLLFNIGPYANAAPRVLIIAVVSAVLVAVGVTWEDRVRDGRRILAFVKAMR